jgi:hypothetical protein
MFRRHCDIGRSATLAVAALVLGVGIASCTEEHSLPSSAGATDAERQVEKAAREMYEAVAKGDYHTAYQFRSQKCKAAISEISYIAAMKNQFDWRGLKDRSPAFSVSVIEVLDDSAQVQVLFNDIPGSFNDPKEPRMWALEAASWRYDNCE